MNNRKAAYTTVSIYMPNKDLYNELQHDLKNLYYQKYGQSLSKSEVIIKSMLVLKDSLSEGNSNYKEKFSIKINRLSRIYK